MGKEAETFVMMCDKGAGGGWGVVRNIVMSQKSYYNRYDSVQICIDISYSN